MHIKQFYEAPEAELLEIRFEENIMSYGDRGAAGGKMSTVDYGDDDDDLF